MSSKKVAAEIDFPADRARGEVVVREYDERRDKAAVEELERRCEVGQPGKAALVTDLMGDPIARVRNFVSHNMLVAEYGNGGEIVGVIRGCMKTVTTGNEKSTGLPVYVRLAYVLGLRVSSAHRRIGVATRLIQELEEWCRENGAEYVYMATECSNRASLNLFTRKCDYVKFRNPTVLVQPVHLHDKALASDIAIIRVSASSAEAVYRRAFSESEFFPKDIDLLLRNNLNLGTFMALHKKDLSDWKSRKMAPPSSFAIFSIWNTKEVFRLRMKGVSAVTHAACLGTRLVDATFPWLKVPSIPNVFKNFGFYFLYGLHMEGKDGPRLMKNLCKFAHNMARHDADCRVVVAEVGQMDPVRASIPYWKKFSWDEDIWCVKKLHKEDKTRDDQWLKPGVPKPRTIFVDPRDL